MATASKRSSPTRPTRASPRSNAPHRARARSEDRIRAAKDTGLANLPFRDFAANEIWLQLVLVAQQLIFHAQTLLLDSDLACCEPKRLRYRLLHTAGRLAFHARTATLSLPRSWPMGPRAGRRLQTARRASRARLTGPDSTPTTTTTNPGRPAPQGAPPATPAITAHTLPRKRLAATAPRYQRAHTSPNPTTRAPSSSTPA